MGELAELKRTTRAALCLECGKCSTMCPLAAFGGFSAARVMSIQDPDTEIHGQAEAVQRCLTCSSCEVRCPQGVRYTDFVRGLRHEVPPAARMTCPHGEFVQAAARLAGSSEDVERDLSWLGDDLKIAEEGEVALFVGCLPLFDVYFGRDFGVEMLEIARSAIRMLNRVGVEPVVLTEERCCGHDLLWGGDKETFQALAEANTAAYKAKGVNHIVTTCAECCRTWEIDYAEAVESYQPKVEHLSEFLAPKLGNGKLAFRETDNGAVTYHDSCRLGRQLGVFDAPRQMLAAVPGTELHEMERSGQDAQCCGTTGFVFCNGVSRELQAKRLKSAAATGATKLVTLCPKCLIHFHCAQTEDRRNERSAPVIEVQDLTVYAANMLTTPEEPSTGASEEPEQTGEAL